MEEVFGLFSFFCDSFCTCIFFLLRRVSWSEVDSSYAENQAIFSQIVLNVSFPREIISVDTGMVSQEKVHLMRRKCVIQATDLYFEKFFFCL